jgi:hypothetical protein
MAAEQGRSIPAQLSRAPGPIFTPWRKITMNVPTVNAPTVCQNVSVRVMLGSGLRPLATSS